jgi:hypothetical protein
MSSYPEKWTEKEKKYRGLSEAELTKKNHKNKCKVTRDAAASAAASAAIGTTAGTSGFLHAPVAMYHTAKTMKHNTKEELTAAIIEENGWKKKEYGPGDRLLDVCRGVANGGLGLEVIGKTLDRKESRS